MSTPLQRALQVLALFFFACYLALFPGATITVALDRVPAWGVAFGGLLLLLQGAATLCWLGARAGRRGLLTGLLIGALAGAVEYIGVTTGLPFGRYTYTDVLQPQILGTVPLAICAAWVMVVPASLALAQTLTPARWGPRAALLVAATLVLLLDLQIETVATRINRYWVWRDIGPYYGVPSANFGAWWLVGLALAGLLRRQATGDRRQEAGDREQNVTVSPSHLLTASRYIPHALYALSTVMFTVTNLARGYLLAGLVGVAVLAGAGALLRRVRWRAEK